MWTDLPPEIEEGNIEYKLKLDNRNKIEKLATQMNWRLIEGYNMYNKHEAIYYLGITNDGK